LSLLIAPEETLVRALNGNPHLQQFRTVFITSIRSSILGRLDRSSIELDVRRAFTSVQLRTILEENHHPFLIVEHNPQLYERARDMAGRVADAMKRASREATILLYAPALDRHLEAMAEYADWELYAGSCAEPRQRHFGGDGKPANPRSRSPDLSRRRQMAGVFGQQRARLIENARPGVGAGTVPPPKKNAMQEGRAHSWTSRPLNCGQRSSPAAGRACRAGASPPRFGGYVLRSILRTRSC
jgi:hypothetical protein